SHRSRAHDRACRRARPVSPARVTVRRCTPRGRAPDSADAGTRGGAGRRCAASHSGLDPAQRDPAGAPSSRAQRPERARSSTAQRGGRDERGARAHRTTRAGSGVRRVSRARGERRLAWPLLLPMLSVLVLMALGPLAWTAWESLHLHDLRMPWRGTPFVGLANYGELVGSGRFRGALGHTLFFTVVSVALEVVLGLALALGL